MEGEAVIMAPKITGREQVEFVLVVSMAMEQAQEVRVEEAECTRAHQEEDKVLEAKRRDPPVALGSDHLTEESDQDKGTDSLMLP